MPAPSLACPLCGAEVSSADRFCSSCGASLRAEPRTHDLPVGGPPEAATLVGDGSRAPGDEMRPITALFADVVGSTALGERLPPDEVKALIGECVSRMSRAVEEFGGTVQAYMGDGIAAYFGVPSTHEDDPERAARAALRILEVVGEYGRDVEAAWGIPEFNVRVGINSGQAAVGLVGGADPQAVALGDTTNVAARLQTAAEPGTIAVGDQTAAHLAHGYLLEPLGELAVKGRETPVDAWRLVGPRSELDEPSLTPLVGREQELSRLEALAQGVAAGRGQIISLVGEAGIGKTRLLGELRRSLDGGATWLEGHCLSFREEPLYWPFVEMLRGWLGLGEGEPEVVVRTRLRAKLSALLGPRLEEAFPYLSRLLSVRLDPETEERIRHLPAEALFKEIRSAYLSWLEALGTDRPVVVAIEDVHWASPSTRHLAEGLLEVVDRAPVTIAITYRAERASEGRLLLLRVMAEYPHRAVEISLGPLSEEAAHELVAALLPAGEGDEATRRFIVLRAEGNPLYLEELVRVLIEGGGLKRRRTWTVTTSSHRVLPVALEGLLVSRIDGLPERARRLAQVAAVVGRSFPRRVLERVVGTQDLDEDLAALLRGGVIRELRRFPDAEYTFKHGLLQEAALSTLTSEARRATYGQVAEAFEQAYSSSLDDHLERLAHYYARSQELPKALEYLERAGAKAAAVDAAPQAAELWERARALAVSLGDEEAERRLQGRIEETSRSGTTAE